MMVKYRAFNYTHHPHVQVPLMVKILSIHRMDWLNSHQFRSLQSQKHQLRQSRFLIHSFRHRHPPRLQFIATWVKPAVFRQLLYLFHVHHRILWILPYQPPVLAHQEVKHPVLLKRKAQIIQYRFATFSIFRIFFRSPPVEILWSPPVGWLCSWYVINVPPEEQRSLFWVQQKSGVTRIPMPMWLQFLWPSSPCRSAWLPVRLQGAGTTADFKSQSESGCW